MSGMTIVRLIVVWYFMVQVVTLAVLPMTVRVLRGLPDKGYSLAKINGILVVGVAYWLAYSYGLLRNERGGVWIALFGVAAVCWIVAWQDVVSWWKGLRSGEGLGALVATELLFLFIFAGWALVRAYDPNVDHTEQPMDLMFMNSIWASPTFPPRDAWLAGYAISYYYLGYWLLVTLARLANTLPTIAYNLGQAVWYGFLWTGCFAIVMNLLAWRSRQQVKVGKTAELQEGRYRIGWISILGGLFAGVVVAFAGNLQVILEWLYAKGYNIDALSRWAAVNDFPEGAVKTGAWFIDNGWWWWRSSRVIADHDLLGNYVTVIDEFPIFSYLLGDNHPHVTAMPVVLLVIGLALNLLFLFMAEREREDVGDSWLKQWLPITYWDAALYVVALGSLIFLNTWDFPPYWLLLVAIIFLAGGAKWKPALAAGGMLLLLSILLYLPYLLSAQSQANGIILNAFNPTRFSQFAIMFGSLLPAVVGALLLGWKLFRPSWATLAWVGAFIIAVPLALLALGTAVAATAWGQAHLPRMELPEGITSYAPLILQRWTAEPWSLLLLCAVLAGFCACLVTLARKPLVEWRGSADLVFVLLLGGIGVGLIYAPEFVFLRDHFGSRMNTVFKFYYQGWLLLGLVASYLIVVALSRLPKGINATSILALVSLVLIAGCLIFPAAGIYSKTGAFGRDNPTLDSMQYVSDGSPDVIAAVNWVEMNTTPDEVVLEGKGDSYDASTNRISTMTGRATLLGWDGHESQWRGDAYVAMAQGRKEALQAIYGEASADELAGLMQQWGIDYLFVGPTEMKKYGITSARVDELASALDTVFAQGQVHIFRPRQE